MKDRKQDSVYQTFYAKFRQGFNCVRFSSNALFNITNFAVASKKEKLLVKSFFLKIELLHAERMGSQLVSLNCRCLYSAFVFEKNKRRELRMLQGCKNIV